MQKRLFCITENVFFDNFFSTIDIESSVFLILSYQALAKSVVGMAKNIHRHALPCRQSECK